MALSYTETKHTTTRETVELKIPKSWGMFTTAGNKSLTKKAETLVADVQKKDTFAHQTKAFAKFFRAWRRMEYSATMGEAGDTAVREAVWCFALKVGKCIDISDDTLDDIWESKDAYPTRK